MFVERLGRPSAPGPYPAAEAQASLHLVNTGSDATCDTPVPLLAADAAAESAIERIANAPAALVDTVESLLWTMRVFTFG